MITQIQALKLVNPDSGYHDRLKSWSIDTRDRPLRDLFIGVEPGKYGRKSARKVWFYREGPQQETNNARKTFVTSDLDSFGSDNFAAFVQRLIACGWDGEIKEV